MSIITCLTVLGALVGVVIGLLSHNVSAAWWAGCFALQSVQVIRFIERERARERGSR